MAHIDEMSEEEIKAHLFERQVRRNEEVKKKWPRASEVLLKEGGQWIVWAENLERLKADHDQKGGYINVHAIKFEDGSIWDVANGWRGE